MGNGYLCIILIGVEKGFVCKGTASNFTSKPDMAGLTVKKKKKRIYDTIILLFNLLMTVLRILGFN